MSSLYVPLENVCSMLPPLINTASSPGITINVKPELLEIAANALNVNSKDIKDNYKELPEINACYFWTSGRGGISVIVNTDGEILKAIQHN